MFSTSDLGRMYELMSIPRTKDPDREPKNPCCRGNGVFLFPGEREYLDTLGSKECYELTFEDDVSDMFKIAQMRWVFHCKGCTPEITPLGCRLYPTLAYLEEWRYRGIILDKDFFYPGPCDVCDDPDAFDEAFLKNAYGVWAWLCTDPKVAGILARISAHARDSGIGGYWTTDPGDNIIWHAAPARSASAG